ncbi:hypothetical protein D6C77_10344 [Aureobasidium pullulans]|nr:hypothetical protein D6C77_10344 [Aureobasidium pullulans]
MPTNNDFISLNDDFGNISMDDDNFTESSIEDMESDPEAETSLTIDYWFGKMYLKCTVAEEVLHTKLQQYPYEEVLRSLQSQGIARPDNILASRRTATSQTEASRVALLALVGNIVRTGRRGERGTLLACLRGNRGVDPSSDSQEHLHTSTTNGRAEPPPQEGIWPSRPAIPREQRPTTLTEQDESLEEMAKYTMALKEHGDRMGKKPFDKSSTKSLNPPWFKWFLSFEGLEEYGEARSKREAKHIASKKMCERLGIRLT